MADYIDLDKVAQRLIQIQEESGLTAKAFCEHTEIASSTYSQIRNKSGKINIEIINKVVKHWGQQYDPLWILLGKEPESGDLFAGPSPSTAADSSELEARLLAAHEEIGRLRAQLESKQSREIEQIMVFYSDKSVENYSREQ